MPVLSVARFPLSVVRCLFPVARRLLSVFRFLVSVVWCLLSVEFMHYELCIITTDVPKKVPCP